LLSTILSRITPLSKRWMKKLRKRLTKINLGTWKPKKIVISIKLCEKSPWSLIHENAELKAQLRKRGKQPVNLGGV